MKMLKFQMTILQSLHPMSVLNRLLGLGPRQMQLTPCLIWIYSTIHQPTIQHQTTAPWHTTITNYHHQMRPLQQYGGLGFLQAMQLGIVYTWRIRSTQILSFDHSRVEGSDEPSSLQRATQVLDSPHASHATYGSADAPSMLKEEQIWQGAKSIELLPAEQTLFEHFVHQVCLWIRLWYIWPGILTKKTLVD
jgi:hypothetical protein